MSIKGEPPNVIDEHQGIVTATESLERLFSDMSDEALEHHLELCEQQDFLGFAAVAGRSAKEALRSGDYGAAWDFYQEQKAEYAKHAIRSEFTPKQALDLESTVHIDLANLLRLQGRHNDALVHIVYWASTLGDEASKGRQDRLRVYLKRCKLRNTSLASLTTVTASLALSPDLDEARRIVQELISRG